MNGYVLYRKFIQPALIFLFLNVAFLKTFSQSASYNPNAGSSVRQWVQQHFSKGKIPPFSFTYGGKKSASFITKWNFTASEFKRIDQQTEEVIYTYKDPKSGLLVKCRVTCFNDFNAVEWVLNFINTSSKNSPLIEKAAVIDQSFDSKEQGNFMLYHAKGSDHERTDFQPIDEKLEINKPVYMTPSGGRSSDNTALPFFNIEMPGHQGIVAAIGWTGKWYANVLNDDANTVSLVSGMEKMKLVLYPAEEIRTPKICLLFWQGADRMIGHNQFRQFILAHHSPKINGVLAKPALASMIDYGDPAPCSEYGCLTESFALALLNRYKQFKLIPEVFWLDAGWYNGVSWETGAKGEWWSNVGNWTPHKERFPNGLKPIADAVHKLGAKFMVWFEPERVYAGTEIHKAHPEWLIHVEGGNQVNPSNYMFNLGNKEARNWMTKMIGDIIEKEGIDNYRQDFNFDPYPYWMKMDSSNRQGIAEIRHIEGLYEFWDSLLSRFPNLKIDNCASGGRRIDLETTSRSTPLWRTDYQYGEPNGYQCHTYGLNFYLPMHGTAVYKTDNYTFRSSLGSTVVMNWEISGRNSESIPDMQKRIVDFKNMREYFYGDYYPLTPSKRNTEEDVWLAYQLNRPVQKDGIIIGFRRSMNMNNSISAKLSGLEEKSMYELFSEDDGTRIRKTGRQLMEGIELIIDKKPGSLLIQYKLISN
jgi:alpha-galactosidase